MYTYYIQRQDIIYLKREGREDNITKNIIKIYNVRKQNKKKIEFFFTKIIILFIYFIKCICWAFDGKIQGAWNIWNEGNKRMSSIFFWNTLY